MQNKINMHEDDNKHNGKEIECKKKERKCTRKWNVWRW